ncbi:uncharacterized protein LOC133515942 [Cydia pomonella]|uniref:uncharacterized protein LOC133515942 n=1 Tax=Cydia pomonella TaxID=82600 RepID=UPI002ADE6C50|nr:uncharacterized protein LOC133515942 [Cydia pomonella]
MKCNNCSLDLASNEMLKCSACQHTLHYFCVGLSEVEFKKILSMNLKKWKCPSCKQPKKPTTPTTTEPKSPLIINGRSDDNVANLPSIVSIDTDILLKSMNSQFQQLSMDMEGLKTSVNGRLDQLSASINGWASKFQELEETVTNVRAEVAAVTEENTALRSQLNVIQQNLDEQEQKARQCNIEIQNLPAKPSENLIHVTLALGKVLNVPLTVESIKAVHRVAPNIQSDRPKNIIVELCSRRLRDDVIAAARARRGVTVGQLLEAAATPSSGSADQQKAESRPIFINEHLTLKNKILYSKTRKAVAEKNYKFVWIKNAAILVRRDDSSAIIRIRKESDLIKL